LRAAVGETFFRHPAAKTQPESQIRRKVEDDFVHKVRVTIHDSAGKGKHTAAPNKALRDATPRLTGSTRADPASHRIRQNVEAKERVRLVFDQAKWEKARGETTQAIVRRPGKEHIGTPVAQGQVDGGTEHVLQVPTCGPARLPQVFHRYAYLGLVLKRHRLNRERPFSLFVWFSISWSRSSVALSITTH
jgi:hypothetical protein